MTDLQMQWAKHFGATPPLGYSLRIASPEKWVRFHALDNAKRYATSIDEHAEILSRANQIAAACFKDVPSLWVIISVFDDPATHPLIRRLSLKKAFSWHNKVDPEFGGDCYAQRVTWENGKFDTMFEAIAEDQIRALIFAPTTGTVFAPYDGGFDVISPRTNELTAMFSDWASNHRLGL